jgi:hypothetical protein
VLEDFSDGVANNFTPQTGTWTTTSGTAGRYFAAPPPNDAAVSTRPLAVAPLSYVEYSATVNAGKAGVTAGLTFATTSTNDFLYAGIVAGTNQVVLGHRSNGNWYIDAVTSATIQPGTDYSLLVALTDATTNTVNVVLNGKSVLSFSYNFLVHDGSVGLFARNGSASFDNVLIRGDDIAYANGGTPQVAASAPSQPTAATPLTADALAPIAAAAKELWTKALSASDPRLAILDQVSILVSDLPDQLLASTTGTTIVLDGAAAGWGWFVDPTPLDNNEFPIVLASGVYAATPSSPAYGHMDLLSTVVHELGNVMGFAEDQGQDVTGATLQAGMRRIPVASAVLSVTTAANGSLSLSNVAPVLEPPITMAAGFNAPSSSNGNGFGPTIALGLPTSSLPGTALVSSVVLASKPSTPGSFVSIDPSLTANLGGNLSGPSTVPPFATGPEASPAEHHSRTANTSGARPGAGEAPTIDWSGTGTLDQLDSSKGSNDSEGWLDDFLNHLGQNATQRNPNAGISVRPTAAGAHAPL